MRPGSLVTVRSWRAWGPISASAEKPLWLPAWIISTARWCMPTICGAGAALVIAGLAAHGVTHVEYIHFIERGYEDLVEKLTALGAEIRRVED